MSTITVELPVDEALFVLAALDRHSASAHADARRHVEMGDVTSPEYDIADTTARKCDGAHRKIAKALYGDDVLQRRLADPLFVSDLSDERELGLL